jgi:hypothetical protein
VSIILLSISIILFVTSCTTKTETLKEDLTKENINSIEQNNNYAKQQEGDSANVSQENLEKNNKDNSNNKPNAKDTAEVVDQNITDNDKKSEDAVVVKRRIKISGFLQKTEKCYDLLPLWQIK